MLGAVDSTAGAARSGTARLSSERSPSTATTERPHHVQCRASETLPRGISRHPTHATAAAVDQMGHLARMDEDRIPARMTSAGRAEAGMGARGCRGASLLGVFCSKGVYNQLSSKNLTSAARHAHFRSGRGAWYVLAQDRKK